MKDFFNNLKLQVFSYFVFTAGEKRGTIALLIVIAICLSLIFAINHQPRQVTDFTNIMKQLQEVKMKSSESPITFSLIEDSSINATDKLIDKTEIRLFKFDPNNLPETDWMKLGLSKKQAQVIKNYESKGGRFYKKTDVKKMYCITPTLYSKLEPYIEIKPKSYDSTLTIKKYDVSNDNVEDKKEFTKKVYDINTASQEELEYLPGIGKWTATNILKQRERLGGFYDTQQLKEVKYMTDSLFDVIKDRITVNPVYIRKLNINTDDYNTLRHPYIDYSIAKVIAAYHKQHGDFKTIDDLKKTGVVNETLFQKIKAYLGLGL